MTYYTYIYLDPRKPGSFHYPTLDKCFLYEPMYVGKGTGKRINVHLRQHSMKLQHFKNNKFKSIIAAAMLPISLKYVEDVSDEEACMKEKELINAIGRIDLGTGSLTNLTNGGAGRRCPSSRKHQKKVDKVCKTTHAIFETYTSLSTAALAHNIPVGNISSVCLLKTRSAGGFIWKFHEESLVFNDKRTRITKLDAQYKELMVFESIAEAAADAGVVWGAVTGCCKGKTGECAGFVWEYADIDDETRALYRAKRDTHNSRTEKGIYRIDKKTGERTDYRSLSEAGVGNNITGGMVNMIAKGKRGKLLGYRLYYRDDRSYDDVVESHNQAVWGAYKAILQLDGSAQVIREWLSPSHACAELGLNMTHLCKVARNQTGKSGGFHWRYK